MPFGPAFRLQRFAKAFFFDIDQFVVRPQRALVILDHQRAEGNRLSTVGMIDRAARLAVHAGDFAVLGLVVGDDCRKVGLCQIVSEFVADDRAKPV